MKKALLLGVPVLFGCARESLVPEDVVTARCADGTTMPAAPGDRVADYLEQCRGPVDFLDTQGRSVVSAAVLKTIRAE